MTEIVAIILVLLNPVMFFLHRFEKVFNTGAKQDEIFESVARPVIDK